MRYRVFILALALFIGPLAAGAGNALAAGSYTVHVASFDDLIPAGDLFNSLYQKLPEADADALRIESRQSGFSVRVGRFDTKDEASKVLKNVRRAAPGASVVRLTDAYSRVKVLIEHRTGITNISITSEPPASAPKDSSPAADLTAEVAAEQETIDSLIGSISDAFAEGDYDRTDALIRRGLKKWPDRHDLYAWYGATLLDTGNPDKAYEQYRRAAELRPTVPEYHAGAGFSLLNSYMDRAKRSIDSFETALVLDPNNSAALEGLGIVYVSIGKQQQAQDMYLRLRQVDPAAAARLREYLSWGVDWSR